MNEPEFTLDDNLIDELAGELEGASVDKDIIAAVLVDTSSSMSCHTTDASGSNRPRIAGANAGVSSLVSYCQSVPFLKRSIWLGVGRFGETVGFDPFKRIDEVRVPKLKASGGTPLGAGLNLALDAIQELVCKLDDDERRFSIPNLCIVSDGAPNSGADLDAAVQRAAKLVKGGDLNISLVGIDQTDCDRLKNLGLAGKSFCVGDLSWEDVIKQATLGGGGTASQHDAA